METELLFTTSKWDILREIANHPQAPLGIAKKLNTTIANVSQQLRLLEAAGLIQKQRVANVGAGQPRALFSLNANYAFLSLASKGLAKKKLLKISPIQVFISRAWLLEDTFLGNILAKFAYTHETFFRDVEMLYFLSSDSSEIILEAITKKKVSPTYQIEFDNQKMKITVKVVPLPSEESELLYNGDEYEND